MLPKDYHISKMQMLIRSILQHSNHTKYWKRRSEVINPNSKVPKIIRYWYLFYIKRCDSFNHCSFGTYMGHGSHFDSAPILPHGPNGIIIGDNLSIGSNVTIFHHVTISGGGAIIGNNVLFSTGVTVLPTVKHIGSNSKIGANCVVVEDVPENATVVMNKPRIIIH